jgi:hypothetical protein
MAYVFWGSPRSLRPLQYLISVIAMAPRRRDRSWYTSQNNDFDSEGGYGTIKVLDVDHYIGGQSGNSIGRCFIYCKTDPFTYSSAGLEAG